MIFYVIAFAPSCYTASFSLCRESSSLFYVKSLSFLFISCSFPFLQIQYLFFVGFVIYFLRESLFGISFYKGAAAAVENLAEYRNLYHILCYYHIEPSILLLLREREKKFIVLLIVVVPFSSAE